MPMDDQQRKQEIRVFIATILSVIILVTFSLLTPHKAPPPKKKETKKVEKKVKPEKIPVKTIHLPPRISKEEKIIKVDTPLYKALFTNRGGVIQHWELKKYWLDLEKKHPVILFDPGKGVTSYPLAIKVDDKRLTRLFQTGLYVVESKSTHIKLDKTHPVARVTFTIVDPVTRKGIKKIYTFHYDSYHIDVKIYPINIKETYRISTGSSFGISTWKKVRVFGFTGPETMVNGKLLKDKVDKIKGPVVHEGNIGWTVLEDKYFLSAFIPENKISRVIIYKNGKKDIEINIEVPPHYNPFSMKLFAGPKEYDRLRAFNVGLDRVISLGWFIVWDLSLISWLAKGLFYLLQVFYKFSHNYGIAIILLTMVIRVFLAPLSYKSFKSMKAMQKLQPEIRKIQKKYKGDRAAMNKALMELYKTHRVNPLGGCLPMLLQLPIFIGLYNLLANTIELRHSPFFLWIHDLSAKDPYYVLPILMGITMLVQQKMTPSTMDPTQSKLMLFMPIMFTFFFLNFPAGLVLYWMVNNLLTIGQQYITMKYLS